jgi:homoserine O-succinyltransferase
MPQLEPPPLKETPCRRTLRTRVVRHAVRQPIRIGLVNNMPDAALLPTERQFLRLLEPATAAFDVQIRLFCLPEIARGAAAEAQLRARYVPIDHLPDSEIDALIVTGCEPVRADLRDEPYWGSLVRLVDWAKDNTVSTMWSCLAAHAAVLHLDGIERQRLPAKLAGLYEFERVSDHVLLRGIDKRVHTPHSRLNGLSARELVQSGYELLTHSEAAGVDAFVKSGRSLFVFLQGHPEYEPDSLYREYRRDMTRFLAGQQETCPSLPQNYFGPKTAREFMDFAETARKERTPGLIESFPACVSPDGERSHASALRLFANWLAYVADVKDTQPRAAAERLALAPAGLRREVSKTQHRALPRSGRNCT